MTDSPIPDRSNDLAAASKLDTEEASLATGTGEPATSDAGPSSSGEGGDGSETTPAGDAPKPSPDI